MYGFGYTTLISSMSKGGPALTARTTAFATATGITDTTILNALNTFDLGLINNGLDTKMKALYPFVGGDASKHSYNFINTSLYQITWFGGITHNSSGVTGNGTNGYGNTNIIPSNILTQNNTSIGVNISSDYNGVGADFGARDTSGLKGLALQTREANNIYYQINSTTNSSTSNTSSIGLWTLSRLASNSSTLYKNTLSFHSNTVVSDGLSSYSIYLLAFNQANTMLYPSPRRQNFAFIADGLNGSEVSALSTLVTNFQTTLGR